MKINTNVVSLNTQRKLTDTSNKIQTPMERLSSGKRINSAKDDAAGLAIAARMVSQTRGTDVAIRNTYDGISLAQTAEGALQEVGSMLQRVRELAVQSANATNSSSDRKALQDEASQLTSEIQRIASTTNFNGQQLLDGTFDSAQFQVGANAGDTISATTANFQTTDFGGYELQGEASSVAATDRIVAAGSITVSGKDGSDTINYSAGDSAKQIADSINQAAPQTGVEASAQTQVDLEFSAPGSYQLNVSADNGAATTVSFNLQNNADTDSLNDAAAAFNEHSATTGVIAEVNDTGTGITLTHNKGETITVSDTTAANGGDVTVKTASSSSTLVADTTADTAVVTGQVTLQSEETFATTGTAGDVTNAAVEGSALEAVADVSVADVEKSNSALATIDAAIARVANQRAEFGALQNRFESTIRHSENYSENISAARSRIQDTDYAKETSELTRLSILQNAGIAMLGQANIKPELALRLLGG